MAEIFSTTGWSIITISLLVLGVIGTVMPFLPGPVLILAAIILHGCFWPGDCSGIDAWAWVVYAVLFIALIVFDFLAGMLGAKMFGASKWGIGGALIGGIVGAIVFNIPGLFIGPFVGALAAELIFTEKSTRHAVRAGTGSFFGTIAGILGKLALVLIILAWFCIDLFYAGQTLKF